MDETILAVWKNTTFNRCDRVNFRTSSPNNTSISTGFVKKERKNRHTEGTENNGTPVQFLLLKIGIPRSLGNQTRISECHVSLYYSRCASVPSVFAILGSVSWRERVRAKRGKKKKKSIGGGPPVIRVCYTAERTIDSRVHTREKLFSFGVCTRASTERFFCDRRASVRVHARARGSIAVSNGASTRTR